MKSLVSTLTDLKLPRPIVAVLGVLADKDWRAMMTTLASAVDEIVLVAPPTAPPSRAWDIEEALAYARATSIKARIELQFDDAVLANDNAAATVVITGSFHTVGDALAVLGESAV